jgi:hypothetical protein
VGNFFAISGNIINFRQATRLFHSCALLFDNPDRDLLCEDTTDPFQGRHTMPRITQVPAQNYPFATEMQTNTYGFDFQFRASGKNTQREVAVIPDIILNRFLPL